jgi:hypothetical protein
MNARLQWFKYRDIRHKSENKILSWNVIGQTWQCVLVSLFTIFRMCVLMLTLLNCIFYCSWCLFIADIIAHQITDCAVFRFTFLVFRWIFAYWKCFRSLYSAVWVYQLSYHEPLLRKCIKVKFEIRVNIRICTEPDRYALTILHVNLEDYDMDIHRRDNSYLI